MISLLLVAALLGGWELYADLGGVDDFILPAPSQIATALWDDRALLWSNLLVTAQEVALGHEHRGVRAHASGVGRLQAAHELEQRRLAAAAGPDDGDDLAGPDLEVDALERAHRAERAAHARQACRTAPINVSRLLRRSLELGRHRSLRGHYPTGSKGQRRVRGRYLSRPPPAPLLVCDGC